ncbi:hypothetical protein [Nocardia shimofusensis]|uniref:hypothetical protein n=1 Tax=Nocardia shimofusensis TaxID=228596 RepID=UPI00082FBD79|nr:hypothetical protein [Nocardia shimofusensis]
MTAGLPEVDLLADHSVLLAIPAFLPAIALVAVIVVIAVRDRRAEAREHGETTRDDSPREREENR